MEVTLIVIMYLSVFCTAGFYYKKNKMIALFYLLFLGVVIAFCVDAPDLNNYRFMFENANSSAYDSYEKGSIAIARLCQNFSLTYYQYRGVIAIIFCVILILAVKRMTNQINYALALLIMYPCIVFGSGLRSAIAFSVSLLSYSYLFDMNRKKKERIVLFIFGIFIATMFHNQSILNLLFVLCEKKLNIKKIIYIAAAEICFLSLLFSGVIYNLASKIISSNKILDWLNISAYGRRPSIIVALGASGIIGVLLWLLKNVISESIKLKVNKKGALCENQSNYESIYVQILLRCERIVQLLFLFIPSFFINFTFERFFQAPILAVMIALTMDNHVKKTMLIGVSATFNLLFYGIIHGNLYFHILTNNMAWKYLLE